MGYPTFAYQVVAEEGETLPTGNRTATARVLCQTRMEYTALRRMRPKGEPKKHSMEAGLSS